MSRHIKANSAIVVMSQVLLALEGNLVLVMMVKPVRMAWASVLSSFNAMEKTIASLICVIRHKIGLGGVYWGYMRRRFFSNYVAVMVP